jgi:hypothetical protein
MREPEKRSGLMFYHYFIAGSAVTDFCEAALEQYLNGSNRLRGIHHPNAERREK